MSDNPVLPGGDGISRNQERLQDPGSHAADLRSIIKGTGVNFLGSIVRTVLLFLYAAFLARILDPSRVGLFFLGVTIMTILGTASTLGLDVGVLRYTALYAGEGDRAKVSGTIAGASFIVLPVSLATGVLLFILAQPLAADVFDKPGFADVLRLFSVGVPLFAMAKLFNAGTQGLKHMRYQVYSRDMAEQSVKFVLTVILMTGGLALFEVVSANVAALVVATVLSFYFLHKIQPVFGLHVERKYNQRRLLKYSMPLAFSMILSLLLMWTDTLFLAYFRSSEEVGTYSIAMRLAVVGAVIMISFNTMFAPIASDFYNRGQHERLMRLLKSVTKWITAVGMPVFVLLAIFSGEALSVLGGGYTIGAAALTILAIGQLVDAASGPVSMLLMMCGRPRIILINNIFIFILDIIICVILIPRYGMAGAAVAYLTTFTTFNIAGYIAVVFLLKLQPFSWGYAKVLMSGTVAALLAVLVKESVPSPWNLVGAFILFVAIYVTAVIWLAFDSSDLEVVHVLKQGLAKAGISRS